MHQKNSLGMHKGVKHKANLSTCNKCDYSCTKNWVPVMHKFRKLGGQEPPRKLCVLCNFTCLTTGGLMFQNPDHLGLEGPPEFKFALCDYTASKKYIVIKHRIREHGILNKINKKALLQCEECKFSFASESFLAKHMYSKYDSVVPKLNHKYNLCNYNFLIKELFAMHIHNEKRAGWTENKALAGQNHDMGINLNNNCPKGIHS